MKTIQFKGFDDWIEIFRGGKQTDSNGTKHDGDIVIDKAVAAFNTAVHEPPLVVGHPKNNTPAFGWVKKLKRAVIDGKNLLLARFKQVDPGFEDLVKKGTYKKRSAIFYSNGMLRHVGFLGGMPPAVKGLADVKFSSDSKNAVVFIFDEDPEEKRFSEKEVEDRIEKARKNERSKVTAEFTEKDLSRKREDHNKKIISFVEAKVKEGVIPPAIAFDGGLVEFMQAISEAPAIDFAEKGNIPPVDWMMGFIGQLEKHKLFGEVALKEKAYEIDGPAADQKTGEEIAEKANNL